VLANFNPSADCIRRVRWDIRLAFENSLTDRGLPKAIKMFSIYLTDYIGLSKKQSTFLKVKCFLDYTSKTSIRSDQNLLGI